MAFQEAFSALILSLILFSFVLAQDVKQTKTSEQLQETKSKLESKALAQLEKIVEQSQFLRVAENRIYIKATAADILWWRNEKRARFFYSEIFTELVSLMSSTDRSDEHYYERAQSLSQLRISILNGLSAKDPQMAVDFLRGTLQPRDQSGNNRGMDTETQLQIRLANQIATKNPKLSLQLARENLKKGFSTEMSELLENLYVKDKDSYNILIKEVLDRLKGVNFAKDQTAANLAVNLLSILKSSGGDETEYQKLIESLASAGANAPSRNVSQNEIYTIQNLLLSLRSHISEIEKYAPGQATALKNKIKETETPIDEHTKAINTFNRLARNGTLDEILDAAAKAPKEYRGLFYEQAMWKAMEQGDFQRAEQIAATDNIGALQRTQLLQEINDQRRLQFINEGKVNEAKELFADVKNTQESISLLLQLANGISNKDDKKAALQILEEANSLIREHPKNNAEMNAKLNLISAYIRLDPERGFELTESLLPQLNDLIAAAAMLSGFENNYVRDDEWLLDGSPGGNIGNSINQYQQQIVALAQIDFDRAVALAEGIGRDEIRLKTLILITQKILSKQQISESSEIK